MRTRTLVVLLVLLGGLYALLELTGKGEGPPRRSEVEPLLLELGGGRPDWILAKSTKDEARRYRFEHVGGLWRMTSPFQDLADQGQLESLQRQLLVTNRRRIATRSGSSPGQLVEWGLAPPRGTVTVGSGDRRVELEVGGEGPVFEVGPGEVMQTIQVAIGDEIYQVAKGFDSILETNRSDLRSRFLFDTRYEGLRSIHIELQEEGGDTREIAAEMDRRGTWRLTRPWACEANRSVLLPWLAAILTTRAMGFRPIEDMPDWQRPETKPWMRLEVSGDFGKESAALHLDDKGQVFAFKANRPSLLELDPRTFRQGIAQLDPRQLISRALWTWSPAVARSVLIEVPRRADPRGEGMRLGFESLRPEPGFRLTLPQVLPADPGAHNDLFAALERISIVDLAEGADGMEAERVLVQPDLVVSLEPHAGEHSEGYEVRIARGAGGRIFAQRGKATLRFIVEVPDWDRLFVPWWTYVEPLVQSLHTSRPVVTLRFEPATPDAGVRVASLLEGTWRIDGEANEDAEAAFMVLRKLVGREVVGRVEQEGPGLGLEELGTIVALSSAPEVEPAQVAGRLQLWRDRGGETVVANGRDGLLYRLRGPDARDLLRPLGID